MKRSRVLSFFATLGLAVAALAINACELGSTALCGMAPSAPIVGFIVTTTTGSDPTNANIYFCTTRKSTGVEECHTLDKLLEDDFEAHEVNTFTWNVSAPIAAGDLDRFIIKNAGGGFLDNSWSMEALRVEALLQSGGTVLLYEEKMSERMDKGDTYDSSQCTY
jgi:hypothetical protein